MWNKVSCGLNVDDETVNFGTRIVAESGTHVYETKTLATIQGDSAPVSNVSLVPKRLAIFYPGTGLCIAVENTLILFDVTCSTVIFNLIFDSDISSFALSNDGIFLFVALKNIEVYYVHLKTHQCDKLSFNIEPNKTENNRPTRIISIVTQYFEQQEIRLLSLFIIFDCGKILRLSDLDLVKLDEAYKREGFSSIQSILSSVKYATHKIPHTNEDTCKTVCKFNDNLFVATGKLLIKWHLNSGSFSDGEINSSVVCPLLGMSIEKLEILQRHHLVGLSSRKLVFICPHTLLPLCVVEDEIFQFDDYTILCGSSEQNIMIFTPGKLLSITYPGFVKKFELKLPQTSFPVINQNEDEDSFEGFMFLEYCVHEGQVSFRVKQVEETHPQCRLGNLLRKGRFSDAEKFARSFNLDVQLVYKEKACRMLEALQPWTKNHLHCDDGYHQNDVKDFLVLLEMIEDVKFVVECCINAITPNSENTKNLQNYGLQRLRKNKVTRMQLSNGTGATVQMTALNKLQTDLGCIALRLDTYMQIHPTSTSVDHWLAFSKTDLLKEIHQHLKKGEIKEATIIWSRHWNQLHLRLDAETAEQMLDDIPSCISANSLLNWLNEFVPIILINHPRLLTSIINWIVTKTKSLELLDQKSWPDGGIQVAVQVLDIVQKSGKSANWNVVSLDHSPIKQLQTFLKNLIQLSRLKNVYSISISYDEFTQNFEDVVNILLNRVPESRVTELIDNFLHPTLLDKHLDSDDVFSHYVQKTISRLPSWCFIPGAPWEIRTAIVTHAIYNTQHYLESVLCIIKAAALPWSNSIQQLVNHALTMKHPLVASIQGQVALIPSKLVLRKYGFTDPYGDANMERIILNIIQRNEEDSLQDSLTLAKSENLEVDVYVDILRMLIEKGDDKKINELLDSLDNELENKIWLYTGLRQNTMRDFDVANVKPFLDYSVCMEKAGVDVKEIVKSCSLEGVTSVKTSVSDMHKRCGRKIATDKALQVILKESIDEEMSVSTLVKRASTLSTALEISQKSLLLRLTALAFKGGYGGYALQLLYSFANLLEDDDLSDEICDGILQLLAEHLPDFIRHMQDTSEDMPHKVSSTLKLLSNIYVQSCSSPGSVLLAAELSQWVSLMTGCIPQVTLFSEQPFHLTRIVDILINFTRTVLESYMLLANNVGNRIIQNVFRFPIRNAEIEVDLMRILPEMLSTLRDQLFLLEQSPVCLQVLCSLYYSLYSALTYVNEFSTSENSPTTASWSENLRTERWEPLINSCILDMLVKLINSRNFELNHGVSLLCGLPLETSIEWLVVQTKLHFDDIARVRSLSLLGCKYSRLQGSQQFYPFFLNHSMTCQWGSRLSKLGISYAEFAQMEGSDIILRLTSITGVDLELLNNLCQELDFDFQESLYMYLKHLVLTWEPEIEITATGMRVKNDARYILNHMKSVYAFIDDRNDFIDYCTVRLWKMINCYYYEMYFVILNLFDQVCNLFLDQGHIIATESQISCMKRHRDILSFLTSYNRVSPPSDREKDTFYKSYPTTYHELPSISEFRLPFTYLIEDPYSVLKPELTLSTYDLWMSVQHLLMLDNSNICSLAIHGSCTEVLTPAANEKKGEWCLHICNRKLLNDVKKCVSYISNYEMACACLFFTVNNMPPGADQVEAALLCYDHTERWVAETNTDRAKERLLKVQKKFFLVTTTHILYKYNLAKQEYLDLVLSPNELISALYHDPAILSRNSSHLSNCPDIHKAVESIGQIHSENVANIKWDLVRRWLKPQSHNMDDTVISHSAIRIMNSMTHLATLDNNLIRACYVLSHEDPQVACDYLVSIAFAKERQSVAKQLRALQCLVDIATPQYINKVTGMDLNSIRKHMKNLWFVYGLEQLGWVCTVDIFDSRDKTLLVEQMLNQQSISVVTLAAHICQAFSINKPEYWNIILKFMTVSNMVDQLKEILPTMEVEWHFLNEDIVAAAWNCVILTSLAQVEELSGDKEQQVKQCLLWVQKCPLSNLLDMKSFKKHLERLKCSTMF